MATDEYTQSEQEILEEAAALAAEYTDEQIVELLRKKEVTKQRQRAKTQTPEYKARVRTQQRIKREMDKRILALAVERGLDKVARQEAADLLANEQKAQDEFEPA